MAKAKKSQPCERVFQWRATLDQGNACEVSRIMQHDPVHGPSLIESQVLNWKAPTPRDRGTGAQAAIGRVPGIATTGLKGIAGNG